uniref:Uncharacterized protein n=1 Tax=Acrobeloides nanus TaxID=290746 RepID=A0A914C6U4_9BILA
MVALYDHKTMSGHLIIICYKFLSFVWLLILSGNSVGGTLLPYESPRNEFFVAESPFSQWNNDVGYSVQEPADFVSDFQSNAEKTKPKFYAGPWGDCSTTCGSGVKTRSVECVAFQGITTNVIKLPDNECDGQTKPSLFQPCQIRACAQKQSEDESNDVMDPGLQSDSGVDSNGHASTNYRGARGSYRWDYGEWGPCSASCLGGKQKSTLKCVDMNRKITVPWSYCDAKQRPIDLSRSCNNHPCPPSWE